MTEGTPGPEDVTRTPLTGPISQGAPKTPREGVRSFKPFMEGAGETNPLIASGKTPQITPFDLAHGKVPAPGPNINTIQQQAKVAHATLGDIANQLKTPKLKLKQSTKYLLKNKLTSAKGHILSASNKIGAKTVKEEEVPAGSGPLQKFLALVTSGQKQLQQTQDELVNVAKRGDEMKPAEMLSIQVKISKAQQELEYSSLLLGKAVDDLKMMMTIQL